MVMLISLLIYCGTYFGFSYLIWKPYKINLWLTSQVHCVFFYCQETFCHNCQNPRTTENFQVLPSANTGQENHNSGSLAGPSRHALATPRRDPLKTLTTAKNCELSCHKCYFFPKILCNFFGQLWKWGSCSNSCNTHLPKEGFLHRLN